MGKDWVCGICLTTTNVSPLTNSALSWLMKNAYPAGKVIPENKTSILSPKTPKPSSNIKISSFVSISVNKTTNPSIDLPIASHNLMFPTLDVSLVCGVCALCSKLLRNALRLAEKAKEAANILGSLKGRGQLNLKGINNASTEITPPVQLSTVYFLPDKYNYEYKFQDIPQVIPEVLFISEAENFDAKSEASIDDYLRVKSDSENSVEINTEAEWSECTLADLKRKKLDMPKKRAATKKERKLLKAKKKLLKNKILQRSKTLNEVKKAQMEMDIKLAKYFEIKKLTMEEQKDEMLIAKESKNYKNSYLKCDLCFKGYADVAAYERHKMRHTEVMGRFKCKICHINCKNLPRHFIENHRFKFTCKECGTVFKNRTAAGSHATYHEGKRFVCDVCGQLFGHKSTYLSHIRIKHPSEEHVCRLCGFSFMNDKGLRFHKSRQHRLDDGLVPEDGPSCTQCNIQFKTSEALYTHERISTNHGDGSRNDSSRFPFPESGWGCGRGHRRLRTEGRRTDHDKVIICEECGKLQPSQQQYRDHCKMHHARSATPPTPRLCNVCGHTFENNKQLFSHARVHNPKFECAVCHKRFSAASSLAAHGNLHTREREHPCHLCGKKFSNQANQKRHLVAIHLGLRSHSCDFCEKSFKSKYELVAHVRHVHLKLPYPPRSRPRRVKLDKEPPSNGSGLNDTC